MADQVLDADPPAHGLHRADRGHRRRGRLSPVPGRWHRLRIGDRFDGTMTGPVRPHCTCRTAHGSAMRIAIVGTGAMGAVYAALLKKCGHDVWAIDPWQEHLDAIASDG